MSTVDLTTEGRSAREVLAWTKEIVDPALRAAVERLPASTRRIAGYHVGWWDPDGQPAMSTNGKALRPAFVLLAAGAVGGGPTAVTAAIPAAVAVELAHNSSLIHDDVMDGDLTRRHRPTAWSVFGTRAAILAGDALQALAFDSLAGGLPYPAVRMLHTALQDLLDGQHADLAFEERGDVDVPECRRMAEAKTAALMSCASGLGALAGGGSDPQIEHLREFGRQTGLAFQVADDLLGIWGDPATTGKPLHSDLANRKKSLPVVAALTSGTRAGRDLAALYRRVEPLTGAELVRAADLVDLAGGRAWSRGLADDLLTEALAELRPAGLEPVARAELAALAELVVRRDR